MLPNNIHPRVFISHSSQDKLFVRKLADDLRNQNLNLWVDEQNLAPGDSIVQGISDGLRDSDYFIVVLSHSSVQSSWVGIELNSILMRQLSGEGVVVLPIRIDDVSIPTLLSDIVYADFRADYNVGLQRLLQVLIQEETPIAASLVTKPTPTTTYSPCANSLDKLTKADLRRRVDRRLSRVDVGVVWYDTFFDKMDDTMSHQPKPNCIIELIERADQAGLLGNLLNNLCHNHPPIKNP